MRFVKFARNKEEQNLIVFDFEGEIFFAACKNIFPGTELLVGLPEDSDGKYGMCKLEGY